MPGPPLIRINFGGSLLAFLKGGGEKVRRCFMGFMEADNEEVATRGPFGGGLNADAQERIAATRRLAAGKCLIVAKDQYRWVQSTSIL